MTSLCFLQMDEGFSQKTFSHLSQLSDFMGTNGVNDIIYWVLEDNMWLEDLKRPFCKMHFHEHRCCCHFSYGQHCVSTESMCSDFKKWTFLQTDPVSVSLNDPSNTVNICDDSVRTVFVTHGENDADHRERGRERERWQRTWSDRSVSELSSRGSAAEMKPDKLQGRLLWSLSLTQVHLTDIRHARQPTAVRLWNQLQCSRHCSIILSISRQYLRSSGRKRQQPSAFKLRGQ